MTWGLESVSVGSGDDADLVDVDLVCQPGTVTAIVGGDGAGKSTTVRALVGLVRPDRGTVRAPARDSIGYLPSTSGVWPDLTVGENLDFVAEVHHVARRDRAVRVDALLSATELGPAQDRLASQLSGGMRQKLGVAMALLSRPRLLVLDEPSTGVDPVSRADLWRLTTTAALGGAAVVFTTTYLEEAERADAITALEDGRVIAAGSMTEIAAAVRGSIVPERLADAPAWRRGREWRSWSSETRSVSGYSPDLTDLLVAAALARENDGGG